MSFQPGFHGKEKPVTVTGNYELIHEGARALEALEAFITTLPDETDVAEFHLLENTPITAVLADDFGAHHYLWAPAGWVPDSSRSA